MSSLRPKLVSRMTEPRVGPSAERARRRMSYRAAGELAPADAAAAIEAEREADLASEPWAEVPSSSRRATTRPCRAVSTSAAGV